ncbi:HlyD family type I secretion periplasmic adaptor subunit [Pelovirga terrestris]|uniref:HlyD family type I secretion periplasmic adaptor subunit n=1 Tax=Pelovirga terrestris TaxID=2771352 RepID=A0A8J6QMF5_9BACT|nr:HlyD family type I secretion periplasmic adaptor subunit [Pelovirga terrestris]MBD1401314.1 HlyD family type I secretion periplasmic adaptor subunit [Pelovirga terrestris]
MTTTTPATPDQGSKNGRQDAILAIQDEHTTPPELNIRFAESRHIIVAGLIVIALFFGIGGIWISFAQISGAVIAQGEVRVDTERKTVEHLEGGIVHRVLVRNGDKVEKGQILLILESARVGAAVDQLQIQLAAAAIEEARLQAERDLSPEPRWPVPDAAVVTATWEDLQLSSAKAFVANRGALRNQTDLLQRQLRQLHAQAESIDEQLVAEDQVVASLEEELAAKEVLFARQFIDRTQILELRRAISDRRSNIARLRGSRAELFERLAEFELRIDSLESEYRQNAITRLVELQQRIFDLRQQLLPLQDARRRLEVVASVAGEVVAMQVQSEGGVVRPGEPILDIVPEDTPLIVESHIRVQDITHIYRGQQADVQLLAFPVRTTPKISAEVVYISADRLLQRTPYGEQPTYIVHVALDKKQLESNNLYLTAGMPASVFIRTNPRTVLDYALEPLLDNFDRALREN